MYAPEDLGYGADWYRNSLLYYHCPKYYFADFVSTYYRVGVGITSKLKLKNFAQQNKSVVPLFLQLHKDKLDKHDLKYLDYVQSVENYLLTGKVLAYFKAFFLLMKNLGNFSVNNNFFKQLKSLFPFKGMLYKIRKWLFGY